MTTMIPDWKTIEHKVTVRNEPRLLVEVDVEPACGVGICEQFVQHGKQVILIYKSELEKLKARTQTEEHRRDWETAVKVYERNLEQQVGKIRDPQARALAVQRFGPSPSSYYQEMHPGSTGLPPIRSFKILKDDVPPPETPANLQSNQMGELVKALSQLLGMSQQQTAKAR